MSGVQKMKEGVFVDDKYFSKHEIRNMHLIQVKELMAQLSTLSEVRRVAHFHGTEKAMMVADYLTSKI